MKPPHEDRTLAQKFRGAIVVFRAIVVGAFFVTVLAYGVRVWLTSDLDRNRLALRSESAAYAAMLDEENGLLAYLLARDSHFIEPYTRGEEELARANGALSEFVGSVPELAAARLDTRLAEENWHERWAKVAANARTGETAPPMSEGKELFDIYRAEQSAFANALNRRNEVLSRREQRMISAGAALNLLVFIALIFLAVRQHRALHDATVTPVAALLRHIRCVRAGQLSVTADRSGPRELAEFAEGLNEIVLELAAAHKSSASSDQVVSNYSIKVRRILDASREFSEGLNLRDVLAAARENTAAVGGYGRVIVWLMDGEQRRLVGGDERSDGATSGAPIPMGHGLAGRAAKSGRITFEDPTGHVRFRDGSHGLVLAIAIPLIVGARVVGALEARHVEAQVTTRDSIEALELLATHAATAIESARLYEVVEESNALRTSRVRGAGAIAF